MVKLVSVVRSEDYPFDRRQLPLVVDDTLTMVAQFNDNCVGCSQTSLKQRELERFVSRFMSLSSDEVAVALMVTSKEVLELLSQLVPCVGCRKSVERLFSQLVSSGHPTLEPLVLTPNSVLSIRREYLFDPKAIFALLYMHGSKLTEVMECIPKSKKNKRCQLHSLDTHKVRSLSSWEDVWDMLSEECREEVILVKCNSLLETMDSYLRKHRFCADCKSKVQHAYRILVKEVDHKNEKGYCAALYNGIRCCRGEGHLHLKCDTEYVRKLVERAEPELQGSRRERHAKTLDIAQEEVLTCMGIHIYERLHKIGQKIRAEEQTWQLLFYLGVDALRKNFEVALEKKQGISNLELMCQELLQEEKAKEQKKKQKQQKQQKKKKNKKCKKENDVTLQRNDDDCACDENTNLSSVDCNDCDLLHSTTQCHFVMPKKQLSPQRSSCSGGGGTRGGGDEGCNRSDCGYSSEGGGSDPSSREGSDVACSEGICNHDGDSVLCQQSECGDGVIGPDSCDSCNSTSPKHSSTWPLKYKSGRGWLGEGGAASCFSKTSECRLNGHRGGGGGISSLMDMLQAFEGDGEEDGEEVEAIPQEDIQQFRANQSHLISQREQYRQRLRKQFANLQLNNNSAPLTTATE